MYIYQKLIAEFAVYVTGSGTSEGPSAQINGMSPCQGNWIRGVLNIMFSLNFPGFARGKK